MPKKIFLTAYDRFDYAVGAIRSGGEDYLLKPVGEVELTVWIQQHYEENLALEDAAANMGMSPFYFSRQVKAATGKTFLDFLTTYRIEKAKERLLSTELSVSEVGRSVGYPDSNYFTKAFKKAVGCAPTAYRSAAEKKSRQ